MIAKSQTDVWSFVYEPQNLPLVDDAILSAERVPGTPRGVGEIHRVRGRTDADGRVTTADVEILKFAPPHRALVRVSDRYSPIQMFGQEEVIPGEDTNATLVRTTWLEVSAADRHKNKNAQKPDQIIERLEHQATSDAESYLTKIRQVVEKHGTSPATN
ncbi:MAG: hypothetical protein ACQSGP_31300 [Frankia sp.]